MATIKSYTDLEQSRKLATILPLESVDAFYPWRELMKDYDSIYVPEEMLMSDLEEDDICAWSLAALFDALPILDNRSPVISKTFDRKYRVTYHSTTYEKAILTSDYDNPVDACYDMILKLHELKIL